MVHLSGAITTSIINSIHIVRGRSGKNVTMRHYHRGALKIDQRIASWFISDVHVVLIQSCNNYQAFGRVYKLKVLRPDSGYGSRIYCQSNTCSKRRTCIARALSNPRLRGTVHSGNEKLPRPNSDSLRGVELIITGTDRHKQHQSSLTRPVIIHIRRNHQQTEWLS